MDVNIEFLLLKAMNQMFTKVNGVTIALSESADSVRRIGRAHNIAS